MIEENNTNKQEKKHRGDFVFERMIGEGSFSLVYECREKKTNHKFAVKCVNKRLIIREKKVKYVYLEKKVLTMLDEHPFFVKLYFTFQDPDTLYFGLNLCPNGDLLEYIRKYGSLDLECAQFYAAEIADAIHFMHSKQIIHRDLKPENVLLDEKMHIKVSDFGSCRILEENDDNKESESKTEMKRNNSFVGTAQFIAPEVLSGKEVHKGCDYWALGCIIYQILRGKHLFKGNHDYDIFRKIMNVELDFPTGFNAAAEDIIRKLVVLDPGSRLGIINHGFPDLQQHEFFKGICWEKLAVEIPPKPKMNSDDEYPAVLSDH